MSENYLGIITENYQWELSSENYDKERIMTQYITLHGTLHGKVEIYRDTGISKNYLRSLFMQGSKIVPIYVVMIPGEKGKELTSIRQGTKVSHHNLAHTFLEGVIA